MAPISGMEYCPRMTEEIKSGSFWRDVFAELFVVFFFSVGNMAILFQPGVPPSTTSVPNSPLLVGIGVAFLWTALGYGLGDYGGAHISSAVTMSHLIRAEITLLRAVFYWVMQLAGALSAALFFPVVFPQTQWGVLGNVYPAEGLQWWQMILVELVITCVLCLGALGTNSVNRKGYIILSSLPVGFAAGAGTIVGLTATGASMSPTKALGSALAYFIYAETSETAMLPANTFISYNWIYWVGPMAGALLAAILYWIFDNVDKQSTSPYGNLASVQGGGVRNPSYQNQAVPYYDNNKTF